MLFSGYNGSVVHTREHTNAGFAHPPRAISLLGVQHGMRVADFGAGSGAYALALAQRVGPSGRVYAIDVQKDLLKRIVSEALRHRLRNIDVIWADLETPRASKLAAQSLDLVVVSNLLFQTHEKAQVLKEAKRIIKKEGKIAVIDWLESFGGMGPIKSDVVTRDHAVEIARSVGLSLVGDFHAGAHHYGLLFMDT